MDEEFSSITHRLRDLLDPDAIFVLVSSHGGVQFIARSTSDHIDVAAMVARFGGGGHERAAAGLIRGRDVESVRVELIELLPEIVRPAITVAQIMSRGPQVLCPGYTGRRSCIAVCACMVMKVIRWWRMGMLSDC